MDIVSRLPVSTWLVAAVTCLLSYLLYIKRQRPANYPPGPFSFPLLGNLPQIIWCGSMAKFLQKYRQAYGSLFSMEIGGDPTMVVSGYDMIYYMLVTKGSSTSLRSPSCMTKYSSHVNAIYPGVLFAPDPHWKTIRSATLSHLRDEGMGRSGIEEKIIEEMDLYMNHYIEPSIDKPVDTMSLTRVSSNVISQIMLGRRFDYDSQEQHVLVNAAADLVDVMMINSLTKNIPLMHLFPYGKREQHLTDDVIIPAIAAMDEESSKLHDAVSHPLNRLVTQISKIPHGAEQETIFSRRNGLVLVHQLYVAGTETLATSMRWALLYMSLHPHKQDKVHEEIDREIGHDRRVLYSDRQRMPYVEAVILESLRVSNLVPTLLPHTTNEDITVDGKVIPSGTTMIFDAGSVLYDEIVFEEPQIFKPERYLQGDITLKKQRTMSFSLGKRMCAGESLARTEQFLIFTTLMQKYTVRLSECSRGVTTEPCEGIVNSPHKHKLVFSRRS